MTSSPSLATQCFALGWKSLLRSDAAAEVPKTSAKISCFKSRSRFNSDIYKTHSTPAPSSQGIPLGSIAENLATGAAGGLLVFILTELLSRAHDRRDAKTAAQVVRDELSEALPTLDISPIPGAISRPEQGNAFDTEAFRTYRLVMHRELDRETMRKVTAAYRQLTGISVNVLQSCSQDRRNAIKSYVTKAVIALGKYDKGRQEGVRTRTIRLQSPISLKPLT